MALRFFNMKCKEKVGGELEKEGDEAHMNDYMFFYKNLKGVTDQLYM